MSRYGVTGVAVVLLALSGCDSPSGGGGDDPSRAQAAAKDKGPVCVGSAPADGVHVLRGGGFRLPGGEGVRYVAADADGTSRTATLDDGAVYTSGGRRWTVRPGVDLTVSGHGYTVRQVCSYRVVLEPKSAEDGAALAAAPPSLKATGGAADAGLCFTTNRSVLDAAADGFPAEDETLSVLDNGGVQRFPTGWSLTVSYVDPATGTAGIGANCAAVGVAAYQDVRVGDPVEFAGVLFKVSGLTEEAVRLKRTSA
ncbi:hypothetical protein ACWCQK_31240 [Streptomyces sp. NPDC002306]